jgi:hypothetical protein
MATATDHPAEVQGLTPVCYFHPYEFEEGRPAFCSADLDGLDTEKVRRFHRFNRLQGIGLGKPMRRKPERLVRDYDIVPVSNLAA